MFLYIIIFKRKLMFTQIRIFAKISVSIQIASIVYLAGNYEYIILTLFKSKVDADFNFNIKQMGLFDSEKCGVI